MRPRVPLSLAALGWLCVAASDPASAHHVMGGKLPATFLQGALSGIGHPIIGIDHLAAIVAVGCLAAWHRTGALLVLGFVLAMMAGVVVHLQSVSVSGSEFLVAISLLALGMTLAARRSLAPALKLGLFVIAGLLHGYALGESIVGAEPAPLYAYLMGLVIIQTAVALAVMVLIRVLAQPNRAELASARLIGAGIVGIGLAGLAAQIVAGN